MKKIIIALFLIFAFRSFAITWEILGPYQNTKGNVDVDLNKSVGENTISIFQESKISFQGNSAGIHTIFNIPDEDSKIEIMSDSEMRAYGWCFEINGILSEDYPDKINFNSNDDHLTWYYAYAHYQDGEWVDFCVPVH